MALTITGENFDEKVLQADQVVMIDFWAEWCGPCRMVGPIIEQLADDYEGKAIIGKLDVDANQDISVKYGIRSIPTVLYFKNGEIVDKQVGATTKSAYEQKLQIFLD